MLLEAMTLGQSRFNAGLLARQSEISGEVFQNGFNFDEAFPED
jgi:hypothetical protein